MPDPGAVTDPPADVSAQEVVEALTAILDSETFAAAPRSRDFLAYIVTEHLAGRGDRLSEHAVARHALGRREYDARLNSAVRVQAVRLRANRGLGWCETWGMQCCSGHGRFSGTFL